MSLAAPWPETSFLMLDLDAFERNARRLAHSIIEQGGKRWRPHVKAIRSPELALRLQTMGAQGVTCATVAEAQSMVDAGITDVLIASQIVGPARVAQVAALNRQARVTVAIDAPAHIALLAQAAQAAGVVIPVVIEVDIGLQRAGVQPGGAAAVLARQVQEAAALEFCGLMAWEGQTTRIADATQKQAAVEASVALLTDAARQCEAAGMAVAIVSCGGTGTYCFTNRIAGVTELQAGGGVFGDIRYRTEFHLPLEQALTLRATVLSRPSARRIVCDAGWKYHGLHPTESQPLDVPGVHHMVHSAEHLTLNCEQDVAGFAPGTRIDFAVGYADSTVFMHRQMLAVRAGALVQVLEIPAHAATAGSG